MDVRAKFQKLMARACSGDARSKQRALRLLVANRPRKLYRYRAARPETITSITTSTEWYSSPAQYNDPFDSLFSHDVDALVVALTGLELPDALRVKIREQAPDLVAHVRASIRISCYCERPDSMLLWSHYADQHRGFCLEYDVEHQPAASPWVGSLHPVVYSSQMLDITEQLVGQSQGRNMNAWFLTALLQKSNEWAYESEWRSVVAGPNAIPRTMEKPPPNLAGALRDVPLPARVILGARIPAEQEAAVRAACAHHNLPLARIQLGKSAYRLHVVAA